MGGKIVSRSEEIRALFILGLLAVLASIRTQNINAPLKNGSFPINPVIDLTILFMTLYAVFMVFGYSEDIIGETASSMFRGIAIQLVWLNFVVLSFFGVIYAIEVYEVRLVYMTIIISIPIAYVIVLKFREFIRKRRLENRTKLSLDEKLLLIIRTLSVVGFVVSSMMIAYYSSEQSLPLFFVTSAFFLVALLIYNSLREKTKPNNSCDDPL